MSREKKSEAPKSQTQSLANTCPPESTPNHEGVHMSAESETMQEQDYHTSDLQTLILEKGVLNELAKYVKDRQAQVDRQLEQGESRKVINERGVHLGTFSKSIQKTTVVPDDPAVILAQAEEQGFSLEDLLPENGTPEAVEALAVLAEHAPHLIQVRVEPEELKVMQAIADKNYQLTGIIPTGWREKTGVASSTRITFTKIGKQLIASTVDQVLASTKQAAITAGGAE